MSKFTSGNWRVDPAFPTDIQALLPDGSVLEVACTSKDVLRGGETPPYVETFANARLIAAAPELLDALIQLLGTVLDGGDRETIPAAELHHYQQLTLSVRYGAEGGAA